MKDDTAERALMLLSAPEIDGEVVAQARLLGSNGAEILRAVATGAQQTDVSPKQRGHAVEILARTGDLEDTDLRDLAGDPAPSVRRHALLALQDRGRADVLLESLQEKGLEHADQALILRALARVGDESDVQETLDWATQQTDLDIRDQAAIALRAMRRRKPQVAEIDDLDQLGVELRGPPSTDGD